MRGPYQVSRHTTKVWDEGGRESPLGRELKVKGNGLGGKLSCKVVLLGWVG
jgi:hypothetical protein